MFWVFGSDLDTQTSFILKKEGETGGGGEGRGGNVLRE